MQCPECEGEGKIEVLNCDMPQGSVFMGFEEAADRAGDVHHYEECPRCEGTGELHRYLFIQSGLGPDAARAFENQDFVADVSDVEFCDCGQCFVFDTESQRTAAVLWKHGADIIKNEME